MASYFGTTQDQTHGHGTPTTLTLANFSITPPRPGKGATVMLHATLSGGQSPNSYAIRYTPDTITDIDSQLPNGTISQEIKLDAYDPAKPLDITLKGTPRGDQRQLGTTHRGEALVGKAQTEDSPGYDRGLAGRSR